MQTPPTPYDRLPARSGDALNVVIETSRGSRNKFAYDPERGLFVLRGVLPAGAVFPFDFGYIPATLGGDGDPLDVLVLMDEPAPVGCLVPCRLVGVIEAEQTERDGTTEKNDRLIAVAAGSRTHESVASLDDVGQDLVREVEHFFESYNDARGKKFRPTGRFGPERARERVEEGIRRAREDGKEGEEG